MIHRIYIICLTIVAAIGLPSCHKDYSQTLSEIEVQISENPDSALIALNFTIDNIQLENENAFAGNLIVHAKNHVVICGGNLTNGSIEIDCKTAQVDSVDFPANSDGATLSINASRDVYIGRINAYSGDIAINCRKCEPYKINFNIGSHVKINQK